MSNEKEYYGKVTRTKEDGSQETNNIVSVLKLSYNEDMKVSVCELENGEYVIKTENSKTGEIGSISLSKDTMFATIATAILFFKGKGQTPDMIVESIDIGDTPKISCSRDLEEYFLANGGIKRQDDL